LQFDLLQELNYCGDVPCIIKEGMSEEEQRTYIENTALARRNLTKEQKEEIARRQIARGISSEDASKNVGMSRRWVNDVQKKC